MAMQTIDQRIAKVTHDAVSKAQFGNKDFRAAIKKAATRVRVSGIGVTIAFAEGKKPKKPGDTPSGLEHFRVAEAWCKSLSDMHEPGIGPYPSPKEFLDHYIRGDFATVRRLTSLSERVLEWLAKWADSYQT